MLKVNNIIVKVIVNFEHILQLFSSFAIAEFEKVYADGIAYCLFSNLERIIRWDTPMYIWEYLPVLNKSAILINTLKNLSYQCLPKRIGRDEFFQN